MKRSKRLTLEDLEIIKARAGQPMAKLDTPSKMRNQKTTSAGGIKFDSKAEAKRWDELLLLMRAGHIKDLSRQVPFILAPAVDLGEARKKPALRYVADFVYFDSKTGARVVEDVKGMATDAYRIKRHLMATVHNIIVKEVK